MSEGSTQPRPPAELRPRDAVLGCSFLLLLVVVCGAFTWYWFRGPSELPTEDTFDPRVLHEWLDEDIHCTLPDGYEARMGKRIGDGKFILIVPARVRFDEGGRPAETDSWFRYVSVPPGNLPTRLDARYHAALRRQGLPAAPQELLEPLPVEVAVAGSAKTAQQYRWEEGGRFLVQYRVPVSKTILVIATGQADSFDRNALDALLASIRTKTP